jgi:hypothetical protein
MTTVVINDNKVYCDSQATAGSMITDYDVQKAINLGSCIVVGAGRWSHVLKFQDWVAECVMAQIAQQEHPYVNIQMPEEMVDDDFMGAILYADGVVELFEGCKDSYETSQPVFLGSGSVFAAGAIKGGADGISAIKAAIELDPFSGGEVKVEEFAEGKRQVTKEELLSMSKDEIIKTLYPEEQPSAKETPVVSDETASKLQEVVETLTAAEDEQVIEITHKDNYFLLYYRYDEEDEIVELELQTEDEELIVISKYALEDYDKSFLYNLAKSIGAKHSHNSGKPRLIENIVTYLEEMIK